MPAQSKLRVPAPVGSFLAASYTNSVKHFDSRAQAMSELGCTVRCTSHCPRAVKKKGNFTFLKCRLRKSQPPCTWASALRENPDKSCEQLQHPTQWLTHCKESKSNGKRGFTDLEEYQKLSGLLAATATTKPTAAVRAARLDGKGVKKVQLKQVQSLKKTIAKRRFSCKTVGQLHSIVRKHSDIPAKRDKGYFCYSMFSSQGSKKRKFTAIATTRKQQQRWVESPNSVAAADGGFKFSVLGWPLHVLGSVNPAGEFTLHALGTTSTMEESHVSDMFCGCGDNTARLTGSGSAGVKKAFAMTDAEKAYRKAMAKAFGSKNMMCFFHVKKRGKDMLMKRYIGSQKEKKVAWKAVSADIDIIRNAWNLPDFLSRCEAARCNWEAEGLADKTTWVDDNGRTWNFVTNF